MKSLFTMLVFALLALAAQAQLPPIMVCNPAGDQCAPYYTLNEAYQAANSGDFIYLPGGAFSLTDTISKEVHIIGAGIAPDSTAATGITSVGGTIYIDGSGSGSTIEGLYCGYITATGEIQDLTLRKCYISNQLNCSSGSSINNSLLIQNIISTIRGAIYNSFIRNCIFTLSQDMYSFNNCTFTNCILNHATNGGSSYCSITGSHYTILMNCIINANGMYAGNSDLSLFNCIFNTTGSISLAALAVHENLIPISQLSDIFVDANFGTFSWDYDYSIPTTSPGHNGGTDGTDIGIYGGDTPWGGGLVPSNPHIYFKNISGTTNAAGDLPVEIKVRSGN